MSNPNPITVGDRCQRCGANFTTGITYVTLKQMGKTVRQASRDVCLGCFGVLVLDSPEFLRKMAELLLATAGETEEDPSQEGQQGT